MDEYGDEGMDAMAPPKASPLPWILFALTVLLAAVIAVGLMIRVDTERSQKLADEQALADAKDRSASIERRRQELEHQVETLTAENAGLKNDRDALQAKLAAATTPAKKATTSSSSKKKSTRRRHH